MIFLLIKSFSDLFLYKDCWGFLFNINLYCCEFNSRYATRSFFFCSLAFLTKINYSLLFFLHLYYSLYTYKDIKTKAYLVFFLNKFTVMTTTRNVDRNWPSSLTQNTMFLPRKYIPRWVRFNPGLGKNYNSSFFAKEKITVLIEYCSDFPRKKLVNPRFRGRIRLFKIGNKTMG